MFDFLSYIPSYFSITLSSSFRSLSTVYFHSIHCALPSLCLQCLSLCITFLPPVRRVLFSPFNAWCYSRCVQLSHLTCHTFLSSWQVSAVKHRDSRGRVVSLVAVAGQFHHDPHNDALSLWLHDAEQDEFLLVQVSACLRSLRQLVVTRDPIIKRKYHLIILRLCYFT